MNNFIFNQVEYKSIDELYFAYYLQELKDNGFVKEFSYETTTYDLASSQSMPYVKKMKTKDKVVNEHYLHGASLTSDFTIEWDKSAMSVFVLNPFEPIEDPKVFAFRLSTNALPTRSQIEIKPYSEVNTTSSISFPVKQKWVFQKYGEYIQKIVPYNPSNTKCLFSLTFYPKLVIKDLKYKVNTKNAKKGTSKIKGSYKTLEQFLDDFKATN